MKSSLLAVLILAQTMKSDGFIIELPNLNSGAGIPVSTNYKLNTTLGQTAPGEYSSAGYRVKSGFQYISSIIPFSFSVSSININFGSLVPGTPSTATSVLTVSSGGAGGYSVKAKENHPLQRSGGNTIADTTCDAGTCSESSAQVWTNNTKYGFGFNIAGNDIAADFIGTTYYRQFADASLSEDMQTIMTMASGTVGRSRTATVTYKVNVSGSQAAGSYNNIVSYTAIPSY